MAEIVGNHPLYVDVRKDTTQEKVHVFMRAFESSGIALRARVWTKTVDDNFRACSDIRIELLKRFQKEGIEIPYTKIKIVDAHEQQTGIVISRRKLRKLRRKRKLQQR